MDAPFSSPRQFMRPMLDGPSLGQDLGAVASGRRSQRPEGCVIAGCVMRVVRGGYSGRGCVADAGGVGISLQPFHCGPAMDHGAPEYAFSQTLPPSSLGMLGRGRIAQLRDRIASLASCETC